MMKTASYNEDQTILNNQRRSDGEEFAVFTPFKSKHEETSKFLVYVLAVTVAVSAVILLFAMIFLHATTPDAKLKSVTVKSLTATSYAVNSSSNANANATASLTSLNVTLAAEIYVSNSNLGRFEYGNSSAAVSIDGVEVGRGTVARGRVGGRGTAVIAVTVEVRSDREMENSASFRSGVELGVLKITCYGELSGRVHLINLIEKERISIVSCTMNLNLRNRTVEELECK